MKISLIVPAMILMACAAAHGLHAQAPTPARSSAQKAVDSLNLAAAQALATKFGHFPAKDDAENVSWVKIVGEDPAALGKAALEMNAQVLQINVSYRASSPEQLVAIWLPKLRTLVKEFNLKANGVHFLSVIPNFGIRTPEHSYVLGVMLDDGTAYVMDTITQKEINVPWTN